MEPGSTVVGKKKYIVTRSFDLLVDLTCFQVGRENGFLLSFDRECT